MGEHCYLRFSVTVADSRAVSPTRTTFSLLVLLPVLAGTEGWQGIKLRARDLTYCFLPGTPGVAVSNYLYYVAVQRINLAVTIIVQRPVAAPPTNSWWSMQSNSAA